MGEKYLDTAQAAKRLGCTQRHVVWLISVGRLAGVNIGCGNSRPTWRIPEDSLVELIHARTEKPGARFLTR